ncbi:hypothetical protein J6590_016588 [Homalodisca vitripennis]|nr:hypothetical protein J6590_016588 [Homalodisca vitripennis]
MVICARGETRLARRGAAVEGSIGLLNTRLPPPLHVTCVVGYCASSAEDHTESLVMEGPAYISAVTEPGLVAIITADYHNLFSAVAIALSFLTTQLTRWGVRYTTCHVTGVSKVACNISNVNLISFSSCLAHRYTIIQK